MFQLHLHAGTDAPLNVTFIRAPSNAWLKVDIPIVFIGEDVCPGLRKGTGILIHSIGSDCMSLWPLVSVLLLIIYLNC